MKVKGIRVMRRRIFAVLLGIAGVTAIGAGFASHRHRGFYGHHDRRAELEAHVADVCLRAAEKLQRENAQRGSAPAP